MKATLYIIGIGPGDPELLTLKGLKMINTCPCLCVPRGKEEGESIALSIVKQVISLENKRIIELYFPMKRDIDQELDKSASMVINELNNGTNVAFITLGDPTIYSTAFYLYERLKKIDAQVKIEVIPAVSSISAAASKLGIALAMADEKIAILPANYLDNLSATLSAFDTVVLMKVNKVFNRIVRALKETNLVDNASYISRLGMNGERIFTDIDKVKEEDLDYFSIVVIKK